MSSTQHEVDEMKNGRDPLVPSTLSPFRYPGGKSGLRSRIISWIRNLSYRPQQFLEPFAGGSSVGLAIAELDLADHVTLVEIDPDVAAVWKVILSGQADALAAHIRRFKLDQASARKTLNGYDDNRVSQAFRCLLRNRISRGGIMAPGAGWLNYGEGGKGIHSRWYPETLARRIERVHGLRKKFTFIEGDGLEILRQFSAAPRTAAFVDPPYVANGRGAGLRLYSHYRVDCKDLFQEVRTFSGPMIITYHRSEIVQREAKAAGIEWHTVNMHTAHTVSKRQLILYKTGLNGTVGSSRIAYA
jgi:DNA adenine methylase